MGIIEVKSIGEKEKNILKIGNKDRIIDLKIWSVRRKTCKVELNQNVTIFRFLKTITFDFVQTYKTRPPFAFNAAILLTIHPSVCLNIVANVVRLCRKFLYLFWYKAVVQVLTANQAILYPYQDVIGTNVK